MFQSFETLNHRPFVAERLQILRNYLQKAGIDGVLVPHSDAFRSEYLAPCDKRLEWLTGFTGSAGYCIVLAQSAAVFVDSRYTLQVKEQVDLTCFTPCAWAEISPAQWLADQLISTETPLNTSPKVIAYDPWLHTELELNAFKKRLVDSDGNSDVVLKPISVNPIDAIWQDQPPAPKAAAHLYPLEYAGETAQSKQKRCAQILRAENLKRMVLTLPDSICWLLNIRGEDVPHNPIVQCFAVIEDNAQVTLFIDPDKADILTKTAQEKVVLAPFEQFLPFLEQCQGTTGVDSYTAPLAVMDALSKAQICRLADPCIAMKAVKNATELEGARRAHLRDAVAVVRFLSWLDRTVLAQSDSGQITLDEIQAAKALESFRCDSGEMLRDISFDTISGFGANGAIVHYRVSEDSNAVFTENQLYLVDSGGQYFDGTTDITRTIAIGTPSAQMRHMFTLVLKGMINLSIARFPEGTTGAELDMLARADLRRSGFDYGHGTGHGVGAYLSVHEGPQSISKRGKAALETGMILSNEPGYYRESAFGIRIENLIAVTEPSIPEGGEIAFLSFETLTLAPIDLRLIEAELLSQTERDWLNAYHERVYTRLFSLVEPEVQKWLEQATQPI